ncbi:DUF2586 family protein [Flavobacterium sp.]
MGQGTGTPAVSVNVNANNLQREVKKIDGVIAFVLTSPVLIGVVKKVFNLNDAEGKGYTAIAAPLVHAALELFYNELGGSQKVYVMGVEDTMTLTQMVTATNENGIKKLLLAGKDITHVVIDRTPGVGYAPGTGFLDVDVPAAVLASKALLTYQTTINRPFRLLIAAKVIDIEEPVYEPNTANNTGVMVLLANDGNGNSLASLAAARIAKYNASVKIGNGQNGPLTVSEAFIGGKAIEDFYPEQLDEFADAGFTVVHQREGSAGYYFGRDNMAGADDFRILVHGSLIDKAQRIATAANMPFLETSVRMNADGTMNAADAKYLEEITKQAILSQMTGQISDVDVIIPTDQNLIETPNLKETVKILPLGYLTWITIEMGLTSNLN